VTAQVPGLVVVTVAPETVHTAGVSERNDTASPEVALAVSGPPGQPLRPAAVRR